MTNKESGEQKDLPQGDTQVVADGKQNVSNDSHQTATSSTKKEYNMGKHIATTAAKTLLACVFIIFVAMLCVYVINPQAMANLCGNLGLKNAEVSCLELLYARNKTDANLYNLIIKLGNTNNPAKQNDYIAKLQASESYSEFCLNLDQATLDANKNGDINNRNLCYIYGTSEYLNSRVVINLISLGKYEDAYNKALIYAQQEQESALACTLFYYMQTLQTSSVSAEIRKTYSQKLIEEDCFAALQEKFDQLKSETATGGQNALNKYAMLKYGYTLYMTYKSCDNDDYAGLCITAKDNYESAFVAWQAAL